MFKTFRKAALATTLATGLAAALLAGGAHAAGTKAAPYGTMAPATTAERHVVITEKTRAVNVNNGETVEFRVNGQSFTWHFQTLRDEARFDLSKIAPSGMINHKVTVHVASHPLYRG